jgi:hypothetical protein
MSNTFTAQFMSDEKNLAFLNKTMWGPNGIRQAEELFSKAEGIEIVNISEMVCHDIAWEEYLASRNPNIPDEKWDLDMMEAESGKYYNTIQMIAKVV